MAIFLVLASVEFARADGIGDSLGLSPFWDWKTIETEHFRLTFPKELTATANLSANYLEQAHQLLSVRMKWAPNLRTQILVIDNADAANGLTSPFQRFGIVLMVTPPDAWFSTTYYEDWLRLLCYHEYTHTLNMDPTVGFYEWFRVIFGDILLPNSLWPSWMLEGLAVYMETRLTGGGRGRSTYYEMLLRAQIEAQGSHLTELSEVGGTYPYFPGGESWYMLGYQLMNQIAKQRENNLGEMSIRSAGRVPFFLNGNLENITGKDWYDWWAIWAKITRDRTQANLAKIRTEPVTSFQPLTHSRYTALGAAVSPDGRWVAYNEDSLEQRNGLVLRDLKSGQRHRLADKVLGVGLAFTPDSHTIFGSEARYSGSYNLFSDLKAYDIERNRDYWLTDSLRARDPDVSADGKWVTFTQTKDETTSLAIAPLFYANARWAVGKSKLIFVPAKYGRVANPKFSPDGHRVVFSLHENGHYAEDLHSVARDGSDQTRLLSNGKYNRFVTFDRTGKLHFVSDITGVDNLYTLEGRSPRQETNFTTGVAMPAFGPDGVYGSIMTDQGWELSRFQIAQSPIATEKVTVTPPPAPEYDAEAKELAQSFKLKQYTTKDYSVFPSILPRQWAPVFYSNGAAYVIGGQVFGFDATDRHRYLLGATYAGDVKKADWIALYTNRTLGPTLTLLGYQTFDFYSYSGGPLDRNTTFDATLSFPIKNTYWTLVPALEFKYEEESIQYGKSTGRADKFYTDRSYTARLNYAQAESSRLGISAEGGRKAEIGVRLYESNYAGPAVAKTLVTETEYWELWEHTVLVPSVKAAWVNERRGFANVSNVEVAGKTRSLFGSLTSDNFDRFRLRGYPRAVFQAQAAGLGSAEFRFPLAQIYRGWGTNPVFFESLSGFVFGEAAYFPKDKPYYDLLPASGGGIHFNTTWLVHVPLILTLEYDQGFRTDVGGKGEAFVRLDLGDIGF